MKRDTVREVLLKRWDPIGIYSGNTKDDEYDLYLDEIMYLIECGDAEQLKVYLLWVEKERMGLSAGIGREEMCMKVAEELLAG